MILHSFGTWTEMNSAWEENVYGEAHTCAYMGLSLEILPCRTYEYLYSYFSNYSIKERHKVKHITSDFFPGYIKLARRLFPNAKISIDRFFAYFTMC